MKLYLVHYCLLLCLCNFNDFLGIEMAKQFNRKPRINGYVDDAGNPVDVIQWQEHR